MCISRKIRKYWRFTCLICIICWLIIIPTVVNAQSTNSPAPKKAPIVLDGQVLFSVGGFGNFSAQERATQINQALIDTVNSPEKITIRLVEVDEQITIQNTNNEQHLLTVSQSDVITAATPYNQASLWVNDIQKVVDRGQKERTTTYQSKAFLSAFLVIMVAIALHLIVQLLRSLSSRHIVKIPNKAAKLSFWHKLFTQWCQFILLSFQLSIWIYAFIYITNLFPQTRSWQYRLNSPLISLGTETYSTLELLSLLGLTIATWFVIKTIVNLVKQFILKKSITEPAIQDLITICLQYTFTTLGLIILWQSWGIDVAALAIAASVLGVGIGFGLQNIANNFISGLILTLERPIKVGDLIKVDDLIGTVSNIGSRSTEILTQDHLTIIIPNSQLLDNRLINWNHQDSLSRLRIPIGVSYNSEPRKVRAALLSAAKNHSEVLRAPRPQILFQKFNDSSLDFELLVWIKDPKKQFRIVSDLNYLIMVSLRRYEIEIPFPKTDVNFSSPRLEKLLTAWLSYQGVNLDLLSDTNTSVNHHHHADSYHKFINNKTALLLNTFEEKLTEIDLEQLVTEMRGDDGLAIADRRYHFNLYPKCFIGSEAVNWIIKQQGFSREEAIELGQILIERGIIHHVTDEHSFQDSYLFYRFCVDE
ncbi:MAG: mechanosensitive ion channel domain-containing protein [Cyanobacteria bacterium P01_A01_bin.40]